MAPSNQPPYRMVLYATTMTDPASFAQPSYTPPTHLHATQHTVRMLPHRCSPHPNLGSIKATNKYDKVVGNWRAKEERKGTAKEKERELAECQKEESQPKKKERTERKGEERKEGKEERKESLFFFSHIFVIFFGISNWKYVNCPIIIFF